MKQIYPLSALLAAATAVGLLWKTEAVTAGVRVGLASCAAVVIPSLFPFMVLAGLIASTNAGRVLGRWVWRAVGRLLCLPENLGAVLLMSFLGGFPVGARMLSEMLSRREIDAKTAEHALCFCVNAGPSFLISAVGASMLGSAAAGVALLGAQLLSSLAIAAGSGRWRTRSAAPAAALPPARDAFVESVRSASAGMLSICAFVVAFSAITAFLGALGLLDGLAGLLDGLTGLGRPFFVAALTGLLEVTGGCIRAAALQSYSGFVLCAFLISFSSLSIIFQVKSCFPSGCGVRFGSFFRSRLLHGTITALLAALFYRFLPPAELAATALIGVPVPSATPDMLVTTVCLICMCSILVLSPTKYKC